MNLNPTNSREIIKNGGLCRVCACEKWGGLRGLVWQYQFSLCVHACMYTAVACTFHIYNKFILGGGTTLAKSETGPARPRKKRRKSRKLTYACCRFHKSTSALNIDQTAGSPPCSSSLVLFVIFLCVRCGGGRWRERLYLTTGFFAEGAELGTQVTAAGCSRYGFK